MEFNQEEFNQFVLDNNIVGFFEKPITLKSGRKSNWYVNWRDVSNNAYLMNRLSNFVINFTKDLNLDPNCFYGVPEGATKLGSITQFRWAEMNGFLPPEKYPLPMGRGKPKDHGNPKDKYFVGAPEGGIIVLEDVTTTGGSLLTTLDSLSELEDAHVIATIGLTNRMEKRDDGRSVKEAIEERGIPYYHLSSGTVLLPKAYKKLKPGEIVRRSIEEEFKRYGVEKIVLEEL